MGSNIMSNQQQTTAAAEDLTMAQAPEAKEMKVEQTTDNQQTASVAEANDKPVEAVAVAAVEASNNGNKNHDNDSAVAEQPNNDSAQVNQQQPDDADADKLTVTVEECVRDTVQILEKWRRACSSVSETEKLALEQLDLILEHTRQVRGELETERNKIRSKAKQLSACLQS